MTLFDWCFRCDEERYKQTKDSLNSVIFGEYYCDNCGSVGQKIYYQRTIKKTWHEYFNLPEPKQTYPYKLEDEWKFDRVVKDNHTY